VVGLGIGLVMAPAMSVATSGVAVEDSGVASAAVNTMQQVGGSISTALLDTLSTTAATNYLADRNPRNPAVARPGRAAQLRHRVLVGGRLLRRGHGRLRPALPPWCAAPDAGAAPVVHL